jgi:hypothetical protein
MSVGHNVAIAANGTQKGSSGIFDKASWIGRRRAPLSQFIVIQIQHHFIPQLERVVILPFCRQQIGPSFADQHCNFVPTYRKTTSFSPLTLEMLNAEVLRKLSLDSRY